MVRTRAKTARRFIAWKEAVSERRFKRRIGGEFLANTSIPVRIQWILRRDTRRKVEMICSQEKRARMARYSGHECHRQVSSSHHDRHLRRLRAPIEAVSLGTPTSN